MRSNRFLAIWVLAAGSFVGCDDTTKPRNPPTDEAAETTEDLRERRRTGTATADDFDTPADDRYSNASGREERRRPDFRERVSSAAEEAEDRRDADADRRRSVNE